MIIPSERLELCGKITWNFVMEDSDLYMEDFDHYSDRYKKLILKHINVSERSRKKMPSFVRNIKHDLNIYIVIRGFNPSNYMTYQEARQFDVERDDNSINILFFIQDNVHNDLLPPTPWIILHRFAHSLFSYDTRYEWNRLINNVYRFALEESLKPTIRSQDRLLDQYSRYIMNTLFTFRAARTGEIASSNEGLIDLLTQSMVKGQAEMKPFVDMKFAHFDKIIVHDPQEAAMLQRKFLQYIDSYTKKKLREAVGKYVRA